MDMLQAILLTVITAATPLVIAASGELVTERSGVLNLGVEGMMIMGAVCAFAAAHMTGSPYLGILAGIASGAVFSLLFGFLTLTLVTNQVEFHPLIDQRKLLAAASETGIPLSSYASIARGEVFKHGLFAEIGANYGKSAVQVVLRWILQKGVSLNTMSTKPDNICANFDIMDFTLSSIDMARIEALTHTNYRIVGRDLVPYAPEWD